MRARVRLFALIAALGAGTIAHAQSGAQEPAETGTSAISGVVSDG